MSDHITQNQLAKFTMPLQFAYFIGLLVGAVKFSSKEPLMKAVKGIKGIGGGAAPVSATLDVKDRLAKLKELHDTLAITDAEYADKKKNILDSL